MAEKVTSPISRKNTVYIYLCGRRGWAQSYLYLYISCRERTCSAVEDLLHFHSLSLSLYPTSPCFLSRNLLQQMCPCYYYWTMRDFGTINKLPQTSAFHLMIRLIRPSIRIQLEREILDSGSSSLWYLLSIKTLYPYPGPRGPWRENLLCGRNVWANCGRVRLPSTTRPSKNNHAVSCVCVRVRAYHDTSHDVS